MLCGGTQNLSSNKRRFFVNPGLLCLFRRHCRLLAPAFLAFLALSTLSLVSCVDKPKVTRAAVTKPSPSPVAASSTDKKNYNSTDDEPAPRKSASPDALESPEPSPSPTPEGSPKGTTSPKPAGSPSASGGGAGSSEAALSLPSSDFAAIPGVPPAEQEYATKDQQCESGQASHLCLQVGSRLERLQKIDEAIQAYLKGCLGKEAGSLSTIKCAYNGDPALSNARGCFLAAALYSQKKDATLEKAALKCACDKKYTPACEVQKTRK